MAGRLDGKGAFITGGTSGIGLAAARAFVREGARVAVTGRDRGHLDAALAELGAGALALAADVDDDAAMAEAIGAAAEAFGGIDIVFSNVGGYIDATLGATPRAAFDKALSTDVTGAFMAVQAALPHMRDGGAIVLMGSVYATMGPPGAASYAASKAAVAAMARTFASELAPRGIRVNVVVPGAIDTPGWGYNRLDAAARAEYKRLIGERALANRMITAEEVANAVLFLASDEASGVNAAEIVVDGGTTGAMAGSPRFRRGEPE